jgi:hypothetical protein
MELESTSRISYSSEAIMSDVETERRRRLSLWYKIAHERNLSTVDPQRLRELGSRYINRQASVTGVIGNCHFKSSRSNATT